MKTLKLIASVLLFSTLSPFTVNADPILTDAQKKKIDNAFGSLLNKQYPGLNMPEANPAMLTDPIIENNVAYYDVLIYTSDGAYIKSTSMKTGAIVNMNNGTHVVTAKVSLDQIIELAKMPQVLFIRGSREMHPRGW